MRHAQSSRAWLIFALLIAALASARKSVVMDSFAAAVEKIEKASISATGIYAKFFSRGRRERFVIRYWRVAGVHKVEKHGKAR
jgi:hypothetical protein